MARKITKSSSGLVRHKQILDGMNQTEKELFALTYDAACRSGKSFAASQGFWQSCIKHNANIDWLRQLAEPTPLNHAAHFVVKRIHNDIHSGNDGSLTALQTVLENAQHFNIGETRLLIKILELVAQTLRPTQYKIGIEIQALNRTIAHQYLPSAQNRLQESITPQQQIQESVMPTQKVQSNSPKQFVHVEQVDLTQYYQRDDEYGQKIETRWQTLWHASHRGPQLASKLENQDATFAQSDNNGTMVFALADGVSTSMGARLASAISAREFCDNLASQLFQKKSSDAKDILLNGTAQAQHQLEKVLNLFMASPESNDFAIVRGQVQPMVAVRLLENTLNPTQKNWGAALSTTLIGGFIQPSSKKNIFDVHLAFIGDGVVEFYDVQKQTVERLLNIDANTTEISNAVCPGPLGRKSVEQSLFLQPFEMKRGDWLLISSDGLARGHEKYLFKVIDDSGFTTSQKHDEKFAWELLENTAKSADAQNVKSLFNDNLSLILLNIK